MRVWEKLVSGCCLAVICSGVGYAYGRERLRRADLHEWYQQINWEKFDGKLRDVAFDVPIQRSSWVALRILPSSHTNPVFVLVGDQPIRASRRSAEWCLKGVDRCWSQKQRFIKADEMQDAKAAYEHAREAYRRIISESDVE